MNLKGYTDYRIAIPLAFQEVFSHFYFAENKSGQTVSKTLLPSYQTVLIFNFGPAALLHSQDNAQIALNKCIVLGPIKKAFDYSLPDQAEILVVSFKDDAFYRFFGNASIAENLPMDPDEVLNLDCFTGLWAELNAVKDNNLRSARILSFCEPYLLHRNKIAEQLANFKNHRQSAIKVVAGENNQSERNTQLNHKKHFGYSEKEFNRYARFLKAIELIPYLLERSAKLEWFEVINQCGYYDQSQLIRDFKHYTNLSPAKYVKFLKDICG